jgi:hypothetical protein
MSHDLLQKRRVLLAADTPNVDSAGAVGEFIFGGPVLVVRVGLITTTAIVVDNSTAFTFALSRRPTVGSTAGAVGLGTFLASAAGVDKAAGTVMFKDLYIEDNDGEEAEDGTTRHEAPNSNLTASETGFSPYVIRPGESFAMTLDTNAEADSGAAIGFVEVIDLPWNGPFVDQATIFEDVSDQD